MPVAILAIKTCTRCGESKPLTEFRKKLDKQTSACKHCLQLAMRDYMASRSQEKVVEQSNNQKTYHEANKDKRNALTRIRWENNKEKYKQASVAWREKNKQHLLDYFSKYRKENLEKILARNSEYCKSKRGSDPVFAMRARLRCLIGNSIKNGGYSKRSRTQEILGCDWNAFKSHIEANFLPGMTWANRNQWHIDHVLPLASAAHEDDVVALNHFTNLQPLWALDNIRKGAKLDWVKDGNSQKETGPC